MIEDPSFALTCSLCGKAVGLEISKTDHDGRAVHEDCYIKRVVTLELSNETAPVIRCPYCRLGNEFRTMRVRVEGWLQCESCGHNAMPLDPEFKCACSKCDASQLTKLPD